MKPEIKYFQNFVIHLHLFTPVVRLAIFYRMGPENAYYICLKSVISIFKIVLKLYWEVNLIEVMRDWQELRT